MAVGKFRYTSADAAAAEPRDSIAVFSACCLTQRVTCVGGILVRSPACDVWWWVLAFRPIS